MYKEHIIIKKDSRGQLFNGIWKTLRNQSFNMWIFSDRIIKIKIISE